MTPEAKKLQLIQMILTLQDEELLARIQALLSKQAITSKTHPAITKGDKSIDPTSLFGVWKDNPRSLEEIRD